MRLSVSAPITRTFLYRPHLTNEAPTSSAYMNPLHAALRSNAGVDPIPSEAATKQPVEGNIISGDAVAQMTRSISFASTPADFIARVAAWLAIDAVVSVDD